MCIPNELLIIASPGSTFIETDAFIDAISPCGQRNYYYSKRSERVYRAFNRSVQMFMDAYWDKNPRIIDMNPDPLEVY